MAGLGRRTATSTFTGVVEGVFVVLKGPRHGQPLSTAGLDEILRGAARRAGVAVTCHQLRHTCLTRLREAGMALEAVQAQAAPLDRVDPALPAPGQRVARAGVPARSGHPGHPGYHRAAVTAAAGAHPMTDLETAYGRAAEGAQRRRRAVRAFEQRFGNLAGWQHADLAEQLDAQPACGRLVAWLIVTGRVMPSADYLLACRGHLGPLGDLVHPQLAAEFTLTGEELGYPSMIVRRQWSALLQIAALCSTAPDRLSLGQIREAMREFADAARRLDGRSLRNLSAAVFGMQTVLFHLGLLEQLPVRDNGRGGGRDADWARITHHAPVLAATMSDYLDQMSVRLRPNSRATIEKSLRLFAGYLPEHHPDVAAVADDAVVQIGSSFWLRVPVGKLHTDRYVPLHPQLKTLLDQWLAHRGQAPRSNLLFLERGRRITASRLGAALAAAAADAGIGHVTAHQLRHTLPPRPSTAACPSRPSPRCWATSHCR